MEIFKEMSGYPDYEISNYGRVKTKSRNVRYTHAVTGKEHFRTTNERFLKQYDNNRTGYKFIQPRLNGKPKNETIHRLVALTFIDNLKSLPCVNHKDGNKHNNCVDNLEWCSNEYNHSHATLTGLKAKGETVSNSKLNKHSIYAIKKLIKMKWSDNNIAELFEVSRSTIHQIRVKKTWVHVDISESTSLTGEELKIKEQ